MKFKYFILFFIFCSSFLKAETFQKDGFLRELLKNNALKINECQGGKAYLDTEKLTISSKGILLTNDSNQQIVIPKVYSDQNGCYIKVESIMVDLDSDSPQTVWSIIWCKSCEAWRTVDINGRCVVCGNIP